MSYINITVKKKEKKADSDRKTAGADILRLLFIPLQHECFSGGIVG